MSIPNFSASPMPVTLQDGTVYLVSPLTSSELLSIIKTFRKNFIQEQMNSIPLEWSAADKAAVAKSIYEEAKKITMEDNEFLDSFETIRLVVFYAIRRNHPDFSLEKAEKLASNPEDMAVIMKALNPSSGEEEKKEKKRTKKP